MEKRTTMLCYDWLRGSTVRIPLANAFSIEDCSINEELKTFGDKCTLKLFVKDIFFLFYTCLHCCNTFTLNV